jgi:Tfp pilus assembly protein PilX
MKIFSKNKYKQEGSILILTLLALVGALSIAVAMSSISIVERKMTTKSRKSVTAFQAANSGIEWAMKKLNDAEPGETITSKFSSMESDGKISCPNGLFNDNDTGCEIYLLDGTNQNRTVINDSSISLDKVVAIRSTGKYGKNEEQVGRALEAYAMPNCRDNEDRIADFCIEEDQSDSDFSYAEATKNCSDSGKRLCSINELLAYWQEDRTKFSNEEWAADITGSNQAATINNQPDIGEGDSHESGGDSYKYRCCRNR